MRVGFAKHWVVLGLLSSMIDVEAVFADLNKCTSMEALIVPAERHGVACMFVSEILPPQQ